MRNLKTTVLLLTSLVLLSACSNPLAGTVVANSAQLCKDWRHQTVSKEDVLTDKTAGGMEASNNSRTVWGCKYGSNTAKKS